MSKKRGLIFLVSMLALIFSVSLVSAQTEGIPLQKDVFLGAPISGSEDLPEEVTFTFYDAQNGITSLGSQTFPRGQYTVDFEFSQSDGVTGGSVARVKAEFTEGLNLKDASGETLKPKELWAALEVDGAEVGARTKVSDETLVRLLLNSDASLATYLTLAYEGDDNPIATIYKDLPISLTSSDGSKKSLSDYFSAVVVGTAGVRTGEGALSLTDPNNWYPNVNNIYYNYGKVGIGTANPSEILHVYESGTRNAIQIGVYGSLGSIWSSGDYVFGSNVKPAPSGINAMQIMNTHASYGARAIRMGITAGGIEFHVKSGSVTAGDVFSNPKMKITNSGYVGIGTTNPTYELAVNGTIRCKELIVDTGWADFVFEENYKLLPLNEVEQFISQNKHLPGIPTEAQVRENGVSVGEISSKLLQKVEELTLYMIDIKKENDSLRTQIASMEAQLKEIQN